MEAAKNNIPCTKNVVKVADTFGVPYFMTINEALRLVIQAGKFVVGGEVFVLDMGEQVRIMDLAKNLVKLSWYSEIEIECSEPRPGEKLFEGLLNENERRCKHVLPNTFIGKADSVGVLEMEYVISKFSELSDAEQRMILVRLACRKGVK